MITVPAADVRRRPPSQLVALALKRGFDVVLSLTVLLLSLPLLAIAAIVVLLETGRPVLYRQWRPGRQAGLFEVLKVRTMRVHSTPAAAMGQVGPDHDLVTGTGRLLRRLKIDELPQLLAVLRGDMSLVGPRPTLPELADDYDDYQRRRLLVRPGLTGWAQVNGGTRLSWPERILLDVWYVDHWSLWLDAVVLARTAAVVIRGERCNPRALFEAHEHADAHGTPARQWPVRSVQPLARDDPSSLTPRQPGCGTACGHESQQTTEQTTVRGGTRWPISS